MDKPVENSFSRLVLKVERGKVSQILLDGDDIRSHLKAFALDATPDGVQVWLSPVLNLVEVEGDVEAGTLSRLGDIDPEEIEQSVLQRGVGQGPAAFTRALLSELKNRGI
ncbi:hypothetical protein [Actinomyces sp. HMSC065F11]|uniref:hypothetical protein n=1 Tax=Actinomyces sp. HMSC065F11 TaxID=1739395 RepID=UPI0008A4FC36|nr:hypothetical protein [Actinomyces sp. HMSC065F11]OFR30566.1 hypothetical protein HMPREF2891_05955 [Actinomyces sp. HMSC065F11]